MDGFPLTYLKGPSGLMSDPYVLIECEAVECSLPARFFFSDFFKQNAVGLSFRTCCG